jgi:hypothetical protein
MSKLVEWLTATTRPEDNVIAALGAVIVLFGLLGAWLGRRAGRDPDARDT